jgi:very-short-patch-repair endonuclease
MTYNQLTQEQFIEQCRVIHGDEYDYSLVQYTNVTKKVKIICKIHGEFEQYADHHKRGTKCPYCRGLKKDTDSFISESIIIHGDKYDYSSVNYINNRTPVRIICKTHGEFKQIPKHHLTGSGCPLCKNKSRGEIAIINILEKSNIKYKRQKTFEGCGINKKLQFDFYLPKYNCCIEFDGEQHFKAVDWFGGEKGFKDRKIRDNIKTNYCKNNKINLIRIRYDENILDKLSFLSNI